MLTDEQIEALRPKIDLCTTWIYGEKHYCFDNRLRTMKWSALIEYPRFRNVAEKADKIYCKMRELGYYCPHVQANDEYFSMRWVEETKVVTIKIYLKRNDFAITYGIGRSSRTIFTPGRTDDFVNALEALTDELTSDGNRGGPVRRSSRPKMGSR